MDRSSLGLLIVLAACGPSVGTDGGSAEGDSSSTSSTTTGATLGTTTTTTSTTTTSADTSGSSSSEGSSSEGGSFIQDPDGGVCACCDVLAQDCKDGSKCVPFFDDELGGCCPTACVEIVADPVELGEPCTLASPGHDDCGAGAMCWTASAGATEGVCVAMCTGSRSDLECDGECTSCWVDDDLWTYACLPSCDPLAPDCPEGSGCALGGQTFACAKDSSADEGAIWTSCSNEIECDAGLSCADAATVTGCEVGRCCVPACDPLDPMACSDAPGGAATCTEVELADDVAACLPGARGLCG